MTKILLAFAMAAAMTVGATDYTWTGAKDAYWTNAANWSVGSEVATAAPGTGDKATFAAIATGGATTINMDGMAGIKNVVFDCGETAYQLGLSATAAQSLRMPHQAQVTVNSGVTANQTIMSIMGITANNYNIYEYLQNDSLDAKLIYKRLVKGSGAWNYNVVLYGAGTIEQDGSTAFDQLSALLKRSTGLYILGDTSTSNGSRMSTVSTFEVSGHVGECHQIQIPAGRYLNTCGGGWSSLIMSASENTRVYGDGVVLARGHWNTDKYSEKHCGNFSVAAGKTLKIESFLKRQTDVNNANTGPGVFGAGTLYLCCSNNLIGAARIEASGATLACDKIGLKGAVDSNLGTGSEIRYKNTGTLEYRGAVDEITDRDLVSSNNSAKISMILANACSESGKTLTWTGAAGQMYDASESYGAKLRFNAENGPIFCDGSLEAGKEWEIEIDGSKGVRLMHNYGANVPVTIIDDGKLCLSNDVAISGVINVSGANAVIEIGENCADVTLPSIPIVLSTAALNIVVPESSSVKIEGKSGVRLSRISINGAAAKVDENGYIVSDGTVYGTSVWTNVVAGGTWETAGNWLNERVPNNYDSIVITNKIDTDFSFTITATGAKSVQGIVEQADKGGNHTLTGNDTFTIGSDGYTLITNTYYIGTGTTGHSQADGGPLNFDIPLHLGASQQWLLGSHHGHGANYGEKNFTKNISSEEGVEWDIYGYARLCFKSGNSDDFKGSVRVGSFMQFDGTNQFNRLGTRKATIVCKKLADEGKTGTTRMSPGLTFIFKTGETNGVCSTPIGVDISAAVSGSRDGWCYDTAPICLGVGSDSGGRHVLTLDGGLSGTATGGSYFTFSQSDQRNVPSGDRAYNYYPDDQKIVLAGDGTQFSLGQNQSIRLHTMIEIANANALGKNNSSKIIIGADGYWGSQMFSSIQGVFLRPGLTYSGAINGNTSVDKDAIQKRIAYMLVGGAANEAGESGTATFSGAISETTTIGYRLRLTSGKDVNARFTGKITTQLPHAHPYGEHPDIIGLGDVTLVNSANSFGTNVCVRSGRLILEHADAAGKKPVWLGGYVPTMTETKSVRCVSASAIELSGTYTLKNEPESGTVQYYGKHLYLTTAQTFDGVSPKAGDYVLINWPARYQYNGIWRVTDDVKHWIRPDEIDDADDLVGKVGLRVKVTEGARFGGKAFMLVTNPSYYRKSVQFDKSNERFDNGNGAPVFHPEPSAEPQVALLTGVDGLTIPYAVEVTDNATTNASIIGSAVANSTTCFSGAINLAKDVTLAAAENALVNFTGNFNGTGDIVSAGAGTNDISTATLANGNDAGFTLASGVLKLTSGQLVSRSLTWRRSVDASSATGDTTGCLQVEGDLDLSGKTISFENFKLRRDVDDRVSAREWTIASVSGTISNLGAVTLPHGWSLAVSADGESLVLKYEMPGIMLLLK